MTHTFTDADSGRGATFRAGAHARSGYLAVATLASAYLYLFVRVQWRVGDEGDMLNGALAVAQGHVPYRDFFDLRGPASFYWLGLFFKLFGGTWLVARVHLLLTGTAISLLVYHLTVRSRPARYAFLPCAIVTAVSLPNWAAAHHHWDSNLFALAAIAVFLQGLDRTRGAARFAWLAASGVLAAISSAFLYQKGFALLAAFVALLLIARLAFARKTSPVHDIAAAVGGYGLVGVIILAWFHHLGALDIFIDSTIRFPLATYGDANRLPYGYQLTAIVSDNFAAIRTWPPALVGAAAVFLLPPLLVVAALPLLVAAAVIALLATRPERLRDLTLVALLLTGSALWYSESHRWDIMHLIYGSPVLLVALGMLWARLDVPAAAARLVPAALTAGLLAMAAGDGLNALGANERIVTRRGTIRVLQDDAALRFLLSDRVKAGDYVFVYPYYPAYYFLADVRNPTRFGEIMYGPGSKPYFDEAIADIEARQVQYILWDTVVEGENLKQWFPAYQHPPEHERWMERYFAEHYDEQTMLNGFRLLRRRNAPEPGSPLPR